MSEMHQCKCKSCTMTIESGDYCQYCSGADGRLLPFAEALERFTQFAVSREPGLAAADARRRTLTFMSEREAWRDHPELRVALKEHGR